VIPVDTLCRGCDVIGQDSRYTTAKIVKANGPAGDARQEMRPAFPTPSVITYTYYRVIAGDRVDTIAYDFYGRADLWWMIADANPEYLDWFDLAPGAVLRIPNG
jgi:phage tail protein X